MDTTDGIDRSVGNGSRSVQQDWIDENTTASPNDWSTAQTTFYYNEAPAETQQKYRRLQQWNDGKGEQDRKSTQFSTMVELDIRAFSNVSELTNYQMKRVIYIIENTDISIHNFGPKSYEKLILAVISLVVDDHIMTEDAIENRAIYRDGFKELMENCGLDSHELQSTRQLVREKTDFF